jgi:hypothetical protein
MSKYAQFDEEEVLDKLFDYKGKAVEFGCHIDHQFSNCKKLQEDGWKVDFFSAEDRGGDEIHDEFITAENINEILEKYGITELDLISIDIDGMDYYVWKALKINPKVVIIEYNIRRPIGVQKYKADNVWNRLNDDFFGSSKEEMIKLGKEKGYELIHENEANLFFKLYEKSTN